MLLHLGRKPSKEDMSPNYLLTAVLYCSFKLLSQGRIKFII